MKAGNVLAGLVIVDISKKPLLAFSVQQLYAFQEIAFALDGRGCYIPFETGNGAILVAFN
jgi:hypothetical protein